MRAGRFVSRNRWLLLLILFSLAVRLYLFLNVRIGVHTDSVTYLILSDLENVRTPGYPLFIEAVEFVSDLFGLASDPLIPIAFVQLFVLGVLNACLIYALALRLTGSRGFSSLVGILYSFDYLVVGFEYSIMTEALSTTLILAVLLCYMKIFDGSRAAPWAAGILSALLLLTKPTFLLLSGVLLFFTFVVHFREIRKKRFLGTHLRVVVIFLILNIVGFGSWATRNKIKYNYFGLSVLLPYQLRHYTNHFFHKYKPDDNALLNRLAEIYIEEELNAPRFEERARNELNIPDTEMPKLFLKMNLKLIRDFPGDFLSLIPASVSLYYGTYDFSWTVPNQRILLNSKAFVPRIFRLFFSGFKFLFTNTTALIVMLIVMPLLLLILLRRRKPALHLAVLSLAVINYTFILSILTCLHGAHMRYRVPVEPLIVLIFLASLFWLVKSAAELTGNRRRI